MKDIGLQILSDITIFSKYSKYIPEKKRRETWDEIVDRYINMLSTKYPLLKEEIHTNAQFIRDKKILPSMRALQFAGIAMEVNNARSYNCSYLPVDSVYAFSETMFLLLGGSGVGFSVQKQHIGKLPAIKKTGKERHYLIEDSIMGWADAIKVLMKSYLEGKFMPKFDFRAIRPKGSKLITAGGKAPGPEPLKLCIAHVQAILDRKKEGQFLSSLECHDILCHISNAVLAGGIRRSACISLFSKDDEDMLTCKTGNWWELNEQRGRCNNTIVLDRNTTTKEEFDAIWKKVELSGSGEPGIMFTDNIELGTNPCLELSLKPLQFCNLTEINAGNIESQQDLNDRAQMASFFGTLQAGFTDFHYLRPQWRKTTEEDALIGVSMTGIASGEVLKYDSTEAASFVNNMNERISKAIGISPASRTTCIKPAGTTSCVLGTSSGIHAWYAEYYLRTIRFNKSEDIALHLMKHHPELCEDDILRPHDTLCVRIPIKAPEGAILRTESAIDTLERIKKFHMEWIDYGHFKGDNTNNVSATVSIDKCRKYCNIFDTGIAIDDYKNPLIEEFLDGPIDEWKAVGEWMWENREYYNGISVLPYFGGTYKQMPFEEITEEEYNERVKHLHSIDLTQVVEHDDNVEFGQVSACAGGACSIE